MFTPKNQSLAISIAYLISYALSTSTTSIAATEEAQAWHLLQHHYEIGDVDVQVCKNAAKIRSDKYEIATAAPDWKVRLYNRIDKKMWIGDPKNFNGIVLRNPYARPYQKVTPLNFVEHRDQHGVPTTVMVDSVGDKLFCADNIEVSPQVAAFLCSYFFVPKIDKVPITYIVAGGAKKKVASKLPDSQKIAWLDPDMGFKNEPGLGKLRLVTMKFDKIRYRKEDFATPSGYKQVADIAQVSYSSDQKSQIEEVMGDLGTASGADLKFAPSKSATAGSGIKTK